MADEAKCNAACENEVVVTIVESNQTPPRSRKDAALDTVNSYMYGSMAAGLIPSPGVDLAAITGIQLKMVHSLSKIYGVPFMKDLGKSFIASLVGSLGPIAVTQGGLLSLVKMVPVVGSIASMAVMPAMAAAFTYAVGKVFIQHFESGGTFLNFDPDAVKIYFAEQFEEGKIKVKQTTKA